ncbi:VOC family protein [Sphingomonas canadensis]|uniref:VOC family protein n=1 Tax=Sphingomonas canadensis TaxID=1219257 RepID=A0ABW3H7G7_9SPHN|nr:VOC family protein [Sphingomonas canadensis]MCW3834724.1 VOC family protein [Sphingomonas canadensis]
MDEGLTFVDEPAPKGPPFDFRQHHCGLSVPDLEASIAWYRELFGFAVEARTYLPHVPFKGAFLRRGDTRIELFEREGARPLPRERLDPDEDLATHGTKHLSLEVSDIHAAFGYLKEKGIDVAMEIFEGNGLAGGYIRDNSGILIELVQHLDGRARV